MLGSVDAELSERFTRNCTTAAFGYARAASAVYAAAANQALDFWATAAKRAEPQPPPRPTTQQAYIVGRPIPPEPLPAPSPFQNFNMTNPWLDERSPAFASVRAWWGMFPLEGNPQSWPMAYTLMTAGVPRDVAMPTAEANIAALEAADAASAVLNKVFASLREASARDTKAPISKARETKSTDESAAEVPAAEEAPEATLFDQTVLGPFAAMMSAWMKFGTA